jgi:hypothetical protein
MEMETSHYGDKNKSWSSCAEREFIFFLWMVLVFQANRGYEHFVADHERMSVFGQSEPIATNAQVGHSVH